MVIPEVTYPSDRYRFLLYDDHHISLLKKPGTRSLIYKYKKGSLKNYRHPVKTVGSDPLNYKMQLVVFLIERKFTESTASQIVLSKILDYSVIHVHLGIFQM